MAQDPILVGTVANDGTGDSWRDAMLKTNANFTDLFTTGGIDNLVIVNTAADFPDAVGGVRELVPTPGDSIVYLIAGKTIDIGADRFTVTGGEVVIRGAHRTASGITSSTTGTMFTCVDSAFFPEFIAFTCAGGQFIDFSNPAAGFQSFASQNLIIFDCDTLGTISGAFVTSFRTLTVVNCQTGGFLWTGTANGQINMSSSLFLSWAGTLFDLGVATFNLISFSSNNRFISPSGATVLSGATGSANLVASGRALVESNIFNGLGTSLSGIDTEDLQWEFVSNLFVDGVNHNTRNDADTFLTASETVTIGSIGVYVAIAGTDWSSSISERFTVSTAGIVTYIGLSNLEISVFASSTVEKVGGGADKICTKIAIDTGSGFVVQDKTIGCTENATATGIMSMGFFAISNGDKIQLFTGNLDSTANIIVSESTMLVKEI